MATDPKDPPGGSKAKEDQFQLKQTSDAFSDRCRDVFSGLNESGRTIKDPVSGRESKGRRPPPQETGATTKHLKNRESIFRISEQEQRGWPLPPPNRHRRGSNQDRSNQHRGPSRGGQDSRPRCRPPPRGPPDHVIHPESYTKYSLADTPGMSHQSNVRAAFDFLQEIRDRKRKADEDEDDLEEVNRKVTFKKPPPSRAARPASPNPKEASGPGLGGGGKRVLPEAQVGFKPKPRETGSQSSKASGSSKKAKKLADDDNDDDGGAAKASKMVLSHLSCLDDDEED